MKLFILMSHIKLKLFPTFEQNYDTNESDIYSSNVRLQA